MDSLLLRSVLECSREGAVSRRLVVLVLMLAGPMLALLTAATNAKEEPDDDLVRIRSVQKLSGSLSGKSPRCESERAPRKRLDRSFARWCRFLIHFWNGPLQGSGSAASLSDDIEGSRTKGKDEIGSVGGGGRGC